MFNNYNNYINNNVLVNVYLAIDNLSFSAIISSPQWRHKRLAWGIARKSQKCSKNSYLQWEETGTFFCASLMLSWLTPVLVRGGTQVPARGYPRTGYPLSQDRTGVPHWPGQEGVPHALARTGLGLSPARTGLGYPPQDWLCRGRYSSCSFPQEDFLVNFTFVDASSLEISVWQRMKR